ncbi:MAG: WecB/TagA/CpsF family glycosyltransferase [Bacillus sp. (in: firmicutes)]
MNKKQIYRKKRDFYVIDSVGVCATTRKQFVEEVFSMPTKPISAYVALVGVPAAIVSKENPEIAKVYSNATMSAIDGMPIVNIGRKKGINCERCAAPDIMGLVFEESVKRGKTHFFYGTTDETLKRLKENLEKDFPGIKITGMYSPPFRPLTEEEDERVVKMINAARPDFLWVGIGAPKQEIWMMEHQNKINDCVMLGVGAGFNFFAGTLDKAPEWMENWSLEWFYRLMKEPKRLWRRYILGGLKFSFYSIQQKFKLIK